MRLSMEKNRKCLPCVYLFAFFCFLYTYILQVGCILQKDAFSSIVCAVVHVWDTRCTSWSMSGLNRAVDEAIDQALHCRNCMAFNCYAFSWIFSQFLLFPDTFLEFSGILRHFQPFLAIFSYFRLFSAIFSHFQLFSRQSFSALLFSGILRHFLVLSKVFRIHLAVVDQLNRRSCDLQKVEVESPRVETSNRLQCSWFDRTYNLISC